MNEIPEWIATIIGRLVLENEALRRALAEVARLTPTETGADAPDEDGPPA
jgi:hypothetical protein